MLRHTRLPLFGLMLSLLFSSAAAFAQDPGQPSLADVARAERQRRANEQRSTHSRVLTNEDLRRERILDGVAAEQDEVPAAAASPYPEVPARPVGPEVSLGEYARQIRRQQQARRARLPVVKSADLERERILPPAALQREGMAPPVSGHARRPTVGEPWPGSAPGELSLGEVARRLRAERAARRQVDAAQRRLETAPAPPAKPAAANKGLTRIEPVRPEPGKSPRRASAGRIIIQRGDSLWKLAKRHLGDSARWTELWRANPEISDPNLIFAGQSVRLPEAVLPGNTTGERLALEGDAGSQQDDADARARIEQISPWQPQWLAPVPRS